MLAFLKAAVVVCVTGPNSLLLSASMPSPGPHNEQWTALPLGFGLGHVTCFRCDSMPVPSLSLEGDVESMPWLAHWSKEDERPMEHGYPCCPTFLQ